MEIIKTVGIKELKNNLSAYLQDVKRGARILVTDRDQVIAELIQPLTTHRYEEEHPLYAQWIREGKVKPASMPNKGYPYPRTGVKFPAGTAQRLIDEDRNEERLERFLLPGKFRNSRLAPRRAKLRKNSRSS